MAPIDFRSIYLQIWNCRGCGRGGRDGLGLVMHVLGLDFLAACEVVEGPRPNPPPDETEEERQARKAQIVARLAEMKAEHEAADATREREANAWREAERARSHRWWRQGSGLIGSLAETYLRARGLDLPPDLRLRFHPAWTLYDGEGDDGRGRVVHRGPALFAPIVEDVDRHERFLGLHTTWFDVDRPGEKILVEGEAGRVPAKKIRGVKAGGHVVLAGHPAPTRMFIGEGIETVLSVWTALSRARSPLLDGAAFWTSVDLGNLGGKALDRIAHPTETKRDSAGRARRVKVPGIVPDLEARAVVIPPSVTDLHLIGDGDSEPFRTRCILARAAARHARPDRIVRLVMAPAGMDFNDYLRGRHVGV